EPRQLGEGQRVGEDVHGGPVAVLDLRRAIRDAVVGVIAHGSPRKAAAAHCAALFFAGRNRTQRSASRPSLPGLISNSASRRSAARSAKRRAPCPATPPWAPAARSIDRTIPAMSTQTFCCPGTSNPATPIFFKCWPRED